MDKMLQKIGHGTGSLLISNTQQHSKHVIWGETRRTRSTRNEFSKWSQGYRL